MKINKQTKERIIEAIIDLAGDELTRDEQDDLWNESNTQLIDRLIHIAHWYANEWHENP